MTYNTFKHYDIETWIKGCLHCHSSKSDGALSPSDVLKYYKAHGYRLVSITDHEKITIVKESNDMIVIPGVELSRGTGKIGSRYHIVAIGVADNQLLKIQDPQEVIDYVNSAGGLSIIAHPYWSQLVHEDLVNINGYSGIEVYNTGCDLEVAKGFATVHWDDLISSGRFVWGYAVDDAHRYYTPPLDAGYGWVWINTADTTIDSIIKSLREGRFYSSMGPRLYEVSVTKTSIFVRSSPFYRMNIITVDGAGMCISEKVIEQLIETSKEHIHLDEFEILNEEDNRKIFLRHANLKVEVLQSREGIRMVNIVNKNFSKYRYIRIEVIDRNGNFAWTNPVNIKEL